MRNLSGEIDRLIQRYRFANMPEDVITEIVEEVKYRLDDAIESAVVNAYYEAKVIGETRNLDAFVDALKIDEVNDSIATNSGRMDFSEPPFPMLPKLLKNAKIAKDGSKYKVIPIGNKSGSTKKTSVDTMRSINDARREMQLNKENRRRDPTNRPSTYMEIRNRMLQSHKQTRNESKSNTGINFRTASSKQDPNTKWVNPGRSGDMRSTLNQINADLKVTIDDVIESILKDYERFV